MIALFRPLRTSIVTGIATIIAGLANPALIACSSVGDAEWQFEEGEMASAIEGEYSGETNGEALHIRLSQAEPEAAPSQPAPNLTHKTLTLPRARLQCAERSFVKSAGACVSFTTMDLDVVIESSGGEIPSRTTRGTFTVFGSELRSGTVHIDIGDDRALNATFQDGVVRDWILATPSGTEPLNLLPVVGL